MLLLPAAHNVHEFLARFYEDLRRIELDTATPAEGVKTLGPLINDLKMLIEGKSVSERLDRVAQIDRLSIELSRKTIVNFPRPTDASKRTITPSLRVRYFPREARSLRILRSRRRAKVLWRR
jgi:hypothetical protein